MSAEVADRIEVEQHLKAALPDELSQRFWRRASGDLEGLLVQPAGLYFPDQRP
jgi:hypothetical protein